MNWTEWIVPISTIIAAFGTLIIPVILFITHRDTNKKIDALRSDIGAQVTTLRSDLEAQVSTLRAVLINVVDVVNSLVAYLSGQSGDKISATINSISLDTLKTSSPQTLSKKGEDLAAQLDAQKIVDKYYKHLQIPEDASKFEIQQGCFAFAFTVLLGLVNAEEKAFIEETIYEAGDSEAAILAIYGILFRDVLLKERQLPVPKRSHLDSVST